MAINKNVLAEKQATVLSEDGNTMYATIQMRHGKESEMDKSKFVPAEMGVATDTKKAFMAFGSNQVKEMMFREDSEIEELLGEVREISDQAVEAVESAEATAKQTIQDFTDQMKATIPEDYNETVKKVDILERTKAPAIYKTASGESLQIEDSADAPVAGLKVFGKGIQNGTPTPDSPVEIEIPGSDGEIDIKIYGKNLIDLNLLNVRKSKVNIEIQGSVIKFTPTADGNAYAGNINTNDSALWPYDKQLLIPVNEISEIKYLISNPYFNDNYVQFYDSNYYSMSYKQYRGNSGTIEVQDQSAYMAFKIGNAFAKVADGTQETTVMIYNPIYNEEFEPFKSPQTVSISSHNGLPGIPVDSGGNYTDSDGQQWICDEVDFTRGKYVQRVKKVDLGDITFNNNNAWTNMQENFVFAYSSNLFSYSDMVLSDKLQSIKYTGNVTSINNESIMVERNSSDPSKGKLYIVIKKERIGEGLTVGVALNSYLKTAGISVLCKIDEVETDLSEEELAAYTALRTNYPTTVVTSDADPAVDMEVEYVADTKTYIDNKFAELAQNLTVTQNILLEV